ncbi:MAG TPA: hypothetical protein VMR98_05485 [Candidatus Polarisedimenticolaceae bacterium]|nr:hypothetical protein [Candidatus Polarisedimenticolaceae bacterium]
MKPQTFFMTLLYLGLAGAVLVLGHYGYALVAAVLVMAPAFMRWLRSGRSLPVLVGALPQVMVGLSVVILVGLSKPPVGQPVFPVSTQVVLAILYGVWLVWLTRGRPAGKSSRLIAGVQQVAVTTAIFLAAAFWHWPSALVVAVIWGASFLIAWWYLTQVGERAASILAATWALVTAELSWILSAWQVNYILYDGRLIVPQAAIIMLGVGYCLASIYHSHSNKRLSRRRLIEYSVIAGVLLAIIIAGTRWNGTV